MSKINGSAKINNTVNVIVPLWNRGEHIKLLLTNIRDIVHKTNEKAIKVWISDFHSSDINLPDLVKDYQFPIEIVLIDRPFIIGKALQLAAERVGDVDELLYFCDADIVLPTGIFARLRKLVVPRKTFYVPLVSVETPHGQILENTKLNSKGCVGVHVKDFVESKGWRYREHYNNRRLKGLPGPMERTSWGGHDRHIFEVLRVVQKLTPIRPIEKDQWIRYHTHKKGWDT